MRFSLIVPTYNEAGAIEELISELSSVFSSASLNGEIVVVDDNSPDGTGQIVDRLASKYPVRCLHRAGKLGLASGVIDGWRFARQDSDVLGVMDADFSHDPKIIPEMLSTLKENTCGLVIGSRYVPGGAISNWPLRRRLTSRVACLLASPLTSAKDVTSGYFFVHRQALEGVTLDRLGFKIGLEVLLKANYDQLFEVPYTFVDRVSGSSKFGGREILDYLIQLARHYRFRILNRKSNSARRYRSSTSISQ